MHTPRRPWVPSLCKEEFRDVASSKRGETKKAGHLPMCYSIDSYSWLHQYDILSLTTFIENRPPHDVDRSLEITNYKMANQEVETLFQTKTIVEIKEVNYINSIHLCQIPTTRQSHHNPDARSLNLLSLPNCTVWSPNPPCNRRKEETTPPSCWWLLPWPNYQCRHHHWHIQTMPTCHLQHRHHPRWSQKPSRHRSGQQTCSHCLSSHITWYPLCCWI